MMNNSHSESYAAAGVDVTAGYKAVKLMRQSVERTYVPGVVSGIGGFGGLFAPDCSGMEKPILVSGTDGVGTKLKLAFLMDKHDTVGIDCVANISIKPILPNSLVRSKTVLSVLASFEGTSAAVALFKIYLMKLPVLFPLSDHTVPLSAIPGPENPNFASTAGLISDR